MIYNIVYNICVYIYIYIYIYIYSKPYGSCRPPHGEDGANFECCQDNSEESDQS